MGLNAASLGDTHLLDAQGNVVVHYVYDAWGNHSIRFADGYEQIAALNPYRYRGYVYDTETNLYYLNSRYYDAETGRFISPDAIAYLDAENINGLNLFAYCFNNPVMMIDFDGTSPKWWQWLTSVVSLIGGAALCFVPGAQAIGVSLIAAGGFNVFFKYNVCSWG